MVVQYSRDIISLCKNLYWKLPEGRWCLVFRTTCVSYGGELLVRRPIGRLLLADSKLNRPDYNWWWCWMGVYGLLSRAASLPASGGRKNNKNSQRLAAGFVTKINFAYAWHGGLPVCRDDQLVCPSTPLACCQLLHPRRPRVWGKCVVERLISNLTLQVTGASVSQTKKYILAMVLLGYLIKYRRLVLGIGRGINCMISDFSLSNPFAKLWANLM